MMKKKNQTKDIYIIRVSDASYKGKKRYLVETNEDELYFDEDTLIKFGLFKDKEFTKEEFNEVLKEAKINDGFNRAIKYLSRSKKTTYEVKEYLRGNKSEKKYFDYDEDIIDLIIKKLKEYKYIDDLDYAKSYLNTYHDYKGPNYIINKLEEKKIYKDIINEVLCYYDDEEKIALNIAFKEIDSLKKYPIKKQKMTLYSRLLSKGFNTEAINYAISKIDFEDNSDEELYKDYQKQLKRLENKELTNQEKKNKIIASLMNKGYDYKNILKVMSN